MVLRHEQIFIFLNFYLDGWCQLIRLFFENNNIMKTFMYSSHIEKLSNYQYHNIQLITFPIQIRIYGI